MFHRLSEAPWSSPTEPVPGLLLRRVSEDRGHAQTFRVCLAPGKLSVLLLDELQKLLPKILLSFFPLETFNESFWKRWKLGPESPNFCSPGPGGFLRSLLAWDQLSKAQWYLEVDDGIKCRFT